MGRIASDHDKRGYDADPALNDYHPLFGEVYPDETVHVVRSIDGTVCKNLRPSTEYLMLVANRCLINHWSEFGESACDLSVYSVTGVDVTRHP